MTTDGNMLEQAGSGERSLGRGQVVPALESGLGLIRSEELDIVDAEVVGDNIDLSDDPDTSMGLSLHIHLLSEHNLPSALHLDDEEAARYHRDEHRHGVQPHSVRDHRFRTWRALRVLLSQDFNALTPGSQVREIEAAHVPIQRA